MPDHFVRAHHLTTGRCVEEDGLQKTRFALGAQVDSSHLPPRAQRMNRCHAQTSVGEEGWGADLRFDVPPPRPWPEENVPEPDLCLIRPRQTNGEQFLIPSPPNRSREKRSISVFICRERFGGEGRVRLSWGNLRIEMSAYIPRYYMRVVFSGLDV